METEAAMACDDVVDAKPKSFDIDGGRQSPFESEDDGDDYDSCCGPPGPWELAYPRLASDAVLPGLNRDDAPMSLSRDESDHSSMDAVDDIIRSSFGSLEMKGLSLKRPSVEQVEVLDPTARKRAVAPMDMPPFKFGQ
mmetsp:Transcript_58056/g.92249  ORF Transcript_58056/g.92249 Transcript_58056/m.92249 type:complete len:138 (-) Transcript_58056:92-505(-)